MWEHFFETYLGQWDYIISRVVIQLFSYEGRGRSTYDFSHEILTVTDVTFFFTSFEIFYYYEHCIQLYFPLIWIPQS